MQVTILGAGSIGLGTAAVLARAGHAITLWGRTLPEGPGTLQGAAQVEGQYQVTTTANIASAVSGAGAVILTVPGYAHRTVLDRLAPNLVPNQPVIISSHASFSALHLRHLVPDVQVAAWGTTIVTGRRTASPPRAVQRSSGATT